jgi:hypothetical protein
MGWLDGLGAGLQNAGNRLFQTAVSQRDFAAQQQNQALARALQEKQLQESTRQHDMSQMQWLVGNTPENTELSPEEAARRQGMGFGSFVKKGDIYAPPEMRNAPGVTDMGGAVTAPPRSGFLSVPTEDARARSSFLGQQAATQRTMATIQGANDRNAQRIAVQDRIAQAAQALRAREIQADMINDQAMRAAELQRIQVAKGQLGMMLQKLQFDQDSTRVAQEIDLYEADMRARNAGAGADRLGALIGALSGNAVPALTPPGAAPAQAGPAPTRPTVPNYRPSGGAAPKAAPQGRRIPPPPK